MAVQIRTFTTQYVPTEDRIRIEASDASETRVAQWLTQRLLLNMVPRLLKWLEKHTEGSAQLSSNPEGAELMQSFAQQAAVTELMNIHAKQASPKPQPPRTGTRVPEWLVQAVDVTESSTRMTLTFRNEASEPAAISFLQKELRQWLSVLIRAWGQANWPSAGWPTWIKGEDMPRQNEMKLH